MTHLLQDFIAWVEAQPPRRKIDIHSSKMDALAQFGRAHFNAPYSCGGVYTFSAGETAATAQVHGFDIPPERSYAWADALIFSTNMGQLAKRLAPFKEPTNARN